VTIEGRETRSNKINVSDVVIRGNRRLRGPKRYLTTTGGGEGTVSHVKSISLKKKGEERSHNLRTSGDAGCGARKGERGRQAVNFAKRQVGFLKKKVRRGRRWLKGGRENLLRPLSVEHLRSRKKEGEERGGGGRETEHSD